MLTKHTIDPTKELRAIFKTYGGMPHIAKKMGLSAASLNRWAYIGRIPRSQLIPLARVMEVQAIQLVHLTNPDRQHEKPSKPSNTLPILIEVKNKTKTLAEAAEMLDMDERHVKPTYTRNEARLELLYDTLLKFRRRKIPPEEAAIALKTTRSEVYRLAETYGMPRIDAEPTVPTVDGGYKDREPVNRTAALRVIAGKSTVKGSRSTFRAWRGGRSIVSWSS